jgi:CHAT domain-containing protein
LNSYLVMGNGEKLTLAQVQNSDNIFSGIELLTLSACDTGYGGRTRDGREIEGLGVLAQRKGARAIMATLWPVDDESTRHLMVEFYRGYQKPGVSKAEALRKAQLAVLGEADLAVGGQATRRAPSPKRFPNPYHWSPFILIGNWH